MDITLNEADGLEVITFPTINLYPKGPSRQKRAIPIAYETSRKDQFEYLIGELEKKSEVLKEKLGQNKEEL